MDVYERRFLAKVNKTEGCWFWTAAVTIKGYGHMRWHGGKVVDAHRISHLLYVGPIPPGLSVDHLCETPLCVNPDHLEAVTLLVNIQRASRGMGTVNRRKTHCSKGHPYDALELGTGRSPIRRCRQCRREEQRLGAARRAAARTLEAA